MHRDAARELLAFYAEAGVDATVGEAPVDRLSATQISAPIPKPAPPRQSVPETPARAAPLSLARSSDDVATPEAAVMAAREAARRAGSLEELRAMLTGFEGCALRATAKQLVFADGNPQARVMFVGEAPGREEDLEGLPFVGRSGKLLDRMMAAIGLNRTTAYIANIIPWRPPGNRTPTPQESQICLPFTLRQVELANPDILVCLGGPSAQTLLGVKDGIKRTRGKWFAFHTGTREIRAIATFHPAYLLRSPLEKRVAWRDFLAIKKALDS
jgi:DNA polymerase